MRIIFVRHGHPDYKKDCLTELGHRQAAAAAERLSLERPSKIFASTCGRAFETAEHIAEKHGLSVEGCDFMREIHWGSANGEEINKGGHPWYVSWDMVTNGQSVMSMDWANEEPFCKNVVVKFVQNVSAEFDSLLATLGYQREGYYYRVEKENNDTVFMVSHGGSSSAALSHLLNIPFPQCCASISPNFTAITVISLSGNVGSLTVPRIEILNDARHIAGIAEKEITFDN